jgi:hypothetical protein
MRAAGNRGVPTMVRSDIHVGGTPFYEKQEDF